MWGDKAQTAAHELLGGALIFTGSILSGLNLDKVLRRSKKQVT